MLTSTLFPLIPVPYVSRPPVSAYASRSGAVICHPLRSMRFHALPRHYEKIRLLTDRQDRSIYKTSLSLTLDFSFFLASRVCQTSQVCMYYLYALATLFDPGGTWHPLLIGLPLQSAAKEKASTPTLYNLRG